MDAGRVPHQLAVMHILLGTTLMLMFVGVLGGTGQLFVLLLEPGVFGMAISVSGSARGVGGSVLGLHAIGVLALIVVLSLWRAGSPRLARSLKPVSVLLLAYAPIGLPAAVMLWWISRQENLLHLSSSMPVIAGNRRTVLVAVWVALSLATMALSFPFSWLPEALGPFAALSGVALGIPQTAALFFILRAAAGQGARNAPLPALPELRGQ
jgi:hypothetical protein